MTLEVKLWKVDDERLTAVESERLDFEDRLEDWLCEDIGVLSHDLLVIGRQIHQYGGVLDLLGVDREGNLVVIELKAGLPPIRSARRGVDGRFGDLVDKSDWASGRRSRSSFAVHGYRLCRALPQTERCAGIESDTVLPLSRRGLP